MEYRSLRFSGTDWQVFEMKAGVFLFQADEHIIIDEIHQAARHIEEALGSDLQDIVPAYDSIGVFSHLSYDKIAKKIHDLPVKNASGSLKSEKIEIPICYEMGLDLEHLCSRTDLSINSFISKHLAATYRSIFIGFTPGFVYADGLDPALACPRRTTPRKHIDVGSIGIGGTQTGIYSLASPGGWNILGRTPMKLFDTALNPPMVVEVGTFFGFKRISQNEFESWGS